MKMKLHSKIRLIFKKLPLSKKLSLKDIFSLRVLLISGGALSIVVFLLFNLSNLTQEKSELKVYMQKANKLYQENKLEEAKNIYLELREKFPSNPHADQINYRLGNIFEELGFIHRAVFFYKKITDKNASYYLDALIKIAQCYQKTGELEKASKVAKTIIKDFPGSEKLSQVYLILAESLLDQSKDKDAISIYQKIIKNYPQTFSAAKAYLKLGNIYFKKGRYSEAILFYSPVVKNYPKSVIQEEAFYHLTKCYLARDEIDEALSVLYLLVKRYPQSKFFVEGLFLVGEVFLDKKEVEKAQKIFERLAKMSLQEPSFRTKSNVKLAEAYLVKDDFTQAIEIYEDIIESCSRLQNAENIYFTLGALYLKTGEYTKAAQIFQKFIHYYPLSSKLSNAYLKLGEAFSNKELYFKAIEAFNGALKYSSSDREAKKALLELAEVYTKVRLWDKAVECLKKESSFASKKEETAAIRIKLIKCYLEGKDLSSAKEYLSLLLEDFPEGKISEILNLADLFYSIGEKRIAFNIYKKVSGSFEPENKRWLFALYKMADLQKEGKDIALAIDTYQKILKLTEKDSQANASLREKTLIVLSDLYYLTQNYKKALNFYLQTIREYPESKDREWCLYQIGNCYRHLKNPKKAKEFYGILKEEFPGSLWAKLSGALL